MRFKVIVISILVIIPMLSFSQENNLKGKWKFNVELIKNECSNWIAAKTEQVKTLEGKKKTNLEKQLHLVKQIESSINFSFSGLVYNFINDNELNISSTKGNVSSKINYQVKDNLLILKYPQLPEPAVYRMEFKEKRLYLYEIVDGIERFAQILERI